MAKKRPTRKKKTSRRKRTAAKSENGDRATAGASGPQRGDFIPPPLDTDEDATVEALPKQEEFWRPPVRFGSIPVESEPLGWDKKKRFYKAYPEVKLPTQVVDRVTFGQPQLEPNRLFWGDNLHVMRQLPSESIDLIYIDPPFFSGRQYNLVWGDQNELRSFSDIWEDGLPGYLVWLNARLYEMKRLLRKSGSIYVHLDHHAAQYVKVELDRIFGYDNFMNEIIWSFALGGSSKKYFQRKHHNIFLYAKSLNSVYFYQPFDQATSTLLAGKPKGARDVWRTTDEDDHSTLLDAWPDQLIEFTLSNQHPERKDGYPTQKPEIILERIVAASSPPDGVVADFFIGGGTTAAVAQRLGRRWIACDQSRVAVAVTADRMANGAEQLMLEKVSHAVPDFTVEHWGIYEAARLAKSPPEQFRQFVLRAFGAVPDDSQPGIHGHKGAVPIWVGEPSQKSAATKDDVLAFANAIRRTPRYQQDNLRDGIMLGWAFKPDAVQAAQRLRELEATDLNFIRLEQIRIDDARFREHIVSLSTDRADYTMFLTFVQPPRVSVGYKRLSARTYAFDVSETAVMNPGAKIINVQWDFNYRRNIFSSTPGYSFLRGKNKAPELKVQYEFPTTGSKKIACKVQDDLGGEGIWTDSIEVK